MVVSLGALAEESYPPGPVFFNPFVDEVITVPVRSTNVEERLDLPTREGLSVEAEISIIYRIRVEAAKSPNAKVIITDGKTPLLINEDEP